MHDTLRHSYHHRAQYDHVTCSFGHDLLVFLAQKTADTVAVMEETHETLVVGRQRCS